MSEPVDPEPRREDAVDPPGPVADRTWRALTWLGWSLAAVVGMAEVAAIVQEAIPTGAISVTTLYGPGQLLSTDFAAPAAYLNAWGSATAQFSWLPFWLYLHLLFEVLFIVGYARLGFSLLSGRRERAARSLLWALIAANLAEAAIAAGAYGVVAAHGQVPAAIGVVLHVATMLKWLTALALLVHVAYRICDSDSGPARQAIRYLFWALWEQRFSVIVVVFLAVVAAGRGSDVLEQMPDVMRSWLTWPPGRGWVHAAVAVTAQLLLALLMMFLGRMRTCRAEQKYSGQDSRRDPGYLPWIVIPAALAGLALVLRLTGWAKVGWWQLAVAVGVPVLIAVSSIAIAGFHLWRRDRQQASGAGNIAWWRLLTELAAAILSSARSKTVVAWSLRRSRSKDRSTAAAARTITDHESQDDDGVPWLGHALPERQPARVASVRTAGDALAVAVAAVTGLGLVRSFTAPALPGVSGAGAISGVGVASGIAVVVGIAIATVSWPLANGPVRKRLRVLAGARGPAARLADWARQGEMQGGVGWWPWLVAGAPFLVADALLVLVPIWTTHWLGVLGTTVIATGTLAVGLAMLAYLAQAERPLPLFRMFRLNVTPVISIILAIGLVGGIANSGSLLHEVRGPVTGGTAPGRTSLLADLQSWLANPATATCAVPAAAGTAGAGRPVRVEPFILVAAAGGGIRAAWWAENALADIAAQPCGPHDVFAVSSVSGGSVGTAVLDSAPADQAGADIARIAGPDALAAGIDGLLLHDLIAGVTGLNLPAAQMPPGDRFSDRADLMETAWQDEDISLEQPFPLRQPALPWRLLFNSADANSGCRAIIADRALPVPPGSQDMTGLTCDLRSAAPGGGSFDFFSRLPCMQDIATVTAAMLSARFPYITPSGVVTSCQDTNVIAGQFVDGGYVDSSGLMTVADLLPSLTAVLRVHNAAALAQAPPGQPVTLVVPVVVYLGNSPRPDPAAFTSPAPIQEPFVPLDAKSAAATELLVSDTLLQRIQGMLGASQWLPCVPGLAGCAAATSAAENTIPDQVIFVSPRTEPAISAPLGWVLSTASRNALNRALHEAEDPRLRCVQPAQSRPKACLPGVGRLADLISLIQGG